MSNTVGGSVCDLGLGAEVENRIRAVQLLKSVGLSEYEAKAYIALLAHGEPMNGYEVAKSSGVPRSTIYEVLAKLVARGAAVQIHGVGRSTESFVAQRSEAFIDSYRSKLSGTLDGLAETLPRVAANTRTHLVQKLFGRESVVQRMNDVMNKTHSFVWLSIWPEVADDLRDTASALVASGIEVVSVVYGQVDHFPGHSVPHEYLDPATTEGLMGCRLFLAVADHQEVVIAASEGEEWWGVWTDELSVSLLAAEHVRYDVSMQVICRHMDFEGNYEALRNEPTFNLLRKSFETGIGEIAARLSEP